MAEVKGQEHITRTLENALKKGAISHAYLFTGPRGVGKTSIARILAHEINKLPYTDDSMHLDIIEIDAASNRRIDEIRDLRDRVNIAPTSAKYKVYIIDEVHMLTREAFNALLKTLEEPPAHVVFILATTEAHKLPDTIVSRTQRFTFKPVPIDEVVVHLRDIAKQEKIDITDEALDLIAKHGEGSFRDSISLLDQAGGHAGKLDATYVRTMLGIPPVEAINEVIQALQSRDAAQIVSLISQLQEQGFGVAQIAKQLGAAWRKMLLEQNGGNANEFELLQKLLAVPAAHDPGRFLDIVLLEYALSGSPSPVPHSASPNNTPPAAIKSLAATKTENPEIKEKPVVKPPRSNTATTKPAHEGTADETEVTPPAAATAVFNDAIWPKVLAELKKKHNTLYGVVRMAQPEFKDGTLELGFAFAFHRKRLSEQKNQAVIAGIIKHLTGNSVAIECVENKSATASHPAAVEVVQEKPIAEPVAAQRATERTDIASISNIFGGGELLES